MHWTIADGLGFKEKKDEKETCHDYFVRHGEGWLFRFGTPRGIILDLENFAPTTDITCTRCH